jgi:phage shock protein A
LVVEGGERDNMRDLLSRFRRALLEHETALDRSKAAREFGQAIDRLIADIQLGRAVKSSLAKGQDFFRR